MPSRISWNLPAFRRDVALMIVSATAFLGYIYYPTFLWMVERWSARDSYYAHGFIIPIVTLYWIFRKRHSLVSEATSNSLLAGATLLIVGAVMQVVACVLRIYFVSGFSFVLVLIGLVELLFGRKVLRTIWFPLAFLGVMIPLPLLAISQITLKMKFLVSELSAYIINAIGIQAVREGSYIFTENSVLLVGDPCSGLRSFLAFLALGLIFAYEGKMSFIRKMVLVALGLPLAILSNVIRVTFLGLVGDIYGMEYTKGIIHDAAGVSVFVLAFVIFMMVKQRLEVHHEKY